MTKPRILIIENSMAVTGALVSIVRSCFQLSLHFNFIFLLPQESSAKAFLEEKSFEVHEMPMLEIRKSPGVILEYMPRLVRNAKSLSKFILSHQVDLIVVNDFYNLLPAIYKFLGGRVPYICYVRFLPSKFPKALVRMWYWWQHKYSYQLIAVSRAVERELPSRDKLIVIGNELPEVATPYKPSNSKVILYFSNYIQGKGQDLALMAFAKVASVYKEWTLKFAGGDMGLPKNQNYKQQLIQLADDLGISEQTEWLDFQHDIREVYEDACFTLNFSESESFSMTVLESMYYGRPVIATRCGGPEEIIDENETGILVPVNDVDAMQKAIMFMITDEDARDMMAEHAYEAVRIKFSKQNTVDRLGALYTNALGPKLNSNNR